MFIIYMWRVEGVVIFLLYIYGIKIVLSSCGVYTVRGNYLNA